MRQQRNDLPGMTSTTMQRQILRNSTFAWVYLTVAYLLGLPLLFAWASEISSGDKSAEAVGVATLGLYALSIIVGVPASIFLWRAVSRIRRARRLGGGTPQYRGVAILGGAWVVAVIGGEIVGSAMLGSNQLAASANVTVSDRSGVAEISYGNDVYRNPNDRCLFRSLTPDLQCGRNSAPICRTPQWLASRHVWPLARVGNEGFTMAGKWHAGSGIFRSFTSGTPPALYLGGGRLCYLEYVRVARSSAG